MTPESRIVYEEVDGLVVPSGDGFFGVLAHHAPMIGQVSVGILTLQQGAQRSYCVLGDGLVEVGGNRVLILADTALKASDLEDAEVKSEDLRKARGLGPSVAPESLSD